MSTETILTILEIVFFIGIVGAYFFVAVHPEEKRTLKKREWILMYAGTIFFAFSKRVPILLFLFAAAAVIIFKLLNSYERNNQGFSG